MDSDRLGGINYGRRNVATNLSCSKMGVTWKVERLDGVAQVIT
jgi:hypothetical protein